MFYPNCNDVSFVPELTQRGPSANWICSDNFGLVWLRDQSCDAVTKTTASVLMSTVSKVRQDSQGPSRKSNSGQVS